MESLDSEAVQALNGLLEDARASAEILVELANGATEFAERESCVAMGQDAVLLSCALRERLAMVGASVSRRVNGIVLHILDVEQYDDRLRAVARHHASICERAQSLLLSTEDRETRKVLRELHDAGVRNVLWCEQRATQFAQSRLLEFRANPLPAASVVPRDADTDAPTGDRGEDATYPHSETALDVHDGNGSGILRAERTHVARDAGSEPPSFGPAYHDGATEDDG